MYKVISFGFRCTSASILQSLQLKTESYPFDWLVSKLDVIKDCIETKFVHFLNVTNYVEKRTETINIIDGKSSQLLCNEVAQVNTYYDTDVDNINTYRCKLALNHHNLNKDSDYYQRCVDRLYELFETDVQKYYLYIHPILGMHDFQTNKDQVLDEFDEFNRFMIKQTKNIIGLYFILVMNNESVTSIVLKETPTYNVFIIYCNNDFLDAGATFMGQCNKEHDEIVTIIRRILT